jgi:rare lipoprotein A
MKNTKTYSELRAETETPNSYSVANHKPVYQPFYKSMYQRQLQNNKILLGFCFTSLTLSALILAGSIRLNSGLLVKNAELTKQVQTGLNMSVQYATYSEDLENRLTEISAKLPKANRGKVSYYSKTGCLGCSDNQQMANGQIFDENKYTIAYNKLPLNTIVTVKNITTGKSVNALVTDRGGFEKYNRIADLSLATCKAIDCKTDLSIIEISL